MRKSSFLVHSVSFNLGALALVLAPGFAFGQLIFPAGAATNTPNQALLLQFQQNQQTLAAQMSQMIAQGATADQLIAWRNQSTLVQMQQSLALQLGSLSGNQPMPLISSVNIPQDASQDLEDFLTTCATLANLRAQIHNELLQQGTYSPEQEESTFESQAKATLLQQDQRAQRVAAASEQQALALPPPLVVPAGATPALQAFLTLRDQLMRAEMAVHNQNLQADAATRFAAVEAWKVAHAAQFQQLRQLAQNLSQTTN